MRRRRGTETNRRRAIASAGPLDSGLTGQIHTRLLDTLGGVVDGIPVVGAGAIGELDAPTFHHHWVGAVFHLDGDAEVSRPTYRAAWKLPGLLVLHTLAVDDVVRSLAAADQPMAWATQREIAEARAWLGRDPMARFVPSSSPSVAAIARRARGVVVFADGARRYLEAIGSRTPVHVVAPPVIDEMSQVDAATSSAAAVRAGLDGCRHLIVAQTDRGEAEDIDRVLTAVRAMASDVHVALVGTADPGRDAVGLRPDDPLAPRLHVHHDLGTAALLTWLAAADVVVDLRRPYHVEITLGVLRSLQAGRALVATSDALPPGVPRSAAVRVDEGADELTTVLPSLLADASRREALGREASAFVRSLRAGGSPGFAIATQAAIRSALDPVAPSMLRWAGALADLGVGDAHLRAGYFHRYASALDSFRGSSQVAAGPAGDPLLDSS